MSFRSLAAVAVVVVSLLVACGTDEDANVVVIEPANKSSEEAADSVALSKSYVKSDDFLNGMEVMTHEGAQETEFQSIAEYFGISYEEAVWIYGWHDDFGSLRRSIRRGYPEEFSWFRFDRDRRAGVFGFHGDIPPDVQVMLQSFSDAHQVEFVVKNWSGFREEDMEEAIPRVHYALFCTEGISDGTTGGDGEIVRSTMARSADSPSIDILVRIAQEALESGPHEGIAVSVEELPEDVPEGYPPPDPDLREKVCAEYHGNNP